MEEYPQVSTLPECGNQSTYRKFKYGSFWRSVGKSLNYFVLGTGGLEPRNNWLFTKKVVLREYFSWMVWLSERIPRGIHAVRVWQPIWSLDVQPWEFLNTHWVILEIFCTHHRWIGTLEQWIIYNWKKALLKAYCSWVVWLSRIIAPGTTLLECSKQYTHLTSNPGDFWSSTGLSLYTSFLITGWLLHILLWIACLSCV